MPCFFQSSTRLTSTESFFPNAKNKGCILRSGSLRKQLGLAWCWKCQWFHQLAGAPYRNNREEDDLKKRISKILLYTEDQVQRCFTIFHPSKCQGTIPALLLTFRCPITNLWTQWFHLDLLKTERCPRSCCSQPAWAWKTLFTQGLIVTFMYMEFCIISKNKPQWISPPRTLQNESWQWEGNRGKGEMAKAMFTGQECKYVQLHGWGACVLCRNKPIVVQ